MLRRLLLAVLGVAIACLAAEAILRLATPADYPSRPFPNMPWMLVDPLAGWKNRAGYHGHVLEVEEDGESPLRINRLGLRGPEIAVDKPEGTLRVACLGDSGTFGMWYGEGEDGRAALASMANYPTELRALLRARGADRIEIVNAGVVGYTTAHGLRMLRSLIEGLEPDVYVVRYGMNDHLFAWNLARRPISPKSPAMRALVDTIFTWRLPRVALYLERNRHSTLGRRRTERWVSPEAFAANLRSFIASGRSSGARVLLVDYPLRPLDWGDAEADAYWLDRLERASLEDIYADHEAYQAILRQVAADETVALLDTRVRLTQAEPRLFGAFDPIHPNPAGARVLAGLVLERLESLGWLEVRRSGGSESAGPGRMARAGRS